MSPTSRRFAPNAQPVFLLIPFHKVTFWGSWVSVGSECGMLKNPTLVAGLGPEAVCVCWKVELKRVASYLSWSCRCWRKVTAGRGQGSGGDWSWGLGWGAGEVPSPEITPMVGHDVGVPTSFQDEDFLLKGGNIIVCEEGQKRKGYCRDGVWGRSQGPRRWGRGMRTWVLSSPGSIFTIFSATRSPVPFSRAL